MYYEINVANSKGHFFATAPRSITDMDKCKAVYKEFQSAFPKDKGFNITVTRCDETLFDVDMNKQS